MTSNTAHCTRCEQPIAGAALNTGELAICPGCAAPLRADVFPALFRPPETPNHGHHLLEESEASCFYHERKRAEVACDGCGRFLCALCDVELNGQHLCPACVDAGRAKGKLTHLETNRKLHDNVALALAVYPVLIFWFTFVTAPITLVYTVRHWNSPRSLLPRTRIRFILAFSIALLQVAGWVLVVCHFAFG